MRALLGAVRWTLAALGGLALLVVLFVGGLYWLARPSADQSLSIPQLSAPAEAVFDQDGVPRIRAANLKDAALVLGYVHARDRMFQMDMMRRLASGRLAALFGRAALPVDREMRTLGLARRAEADAEALPPDAKAMLQAYADGVNAWIARRGRFAAPEFVALGAPGPWKPSDSLLWGKLMGLWLSMNWRQELARWKLIGRMPRAEILALWPNQPEQGAPDAPLQQAFAPASGAARYADLSRPLPFPSQEAAQESNEWAVDGVHSATGAPLLAGDQRRAGRAVHPVHRPLVRFLRRFLTRKRQRARKIGVARRAARRCERLLQRRVRRALFRLIWPERQYLGPRHPADELPARQFLAPVHRQPKAHQLAPEQGIARLPRPGRAERHELRCGEPAAPGDPGVHPVCVGLQHRLGVGRQRLGIRLRAARQPERPHLPIDRQRGAAEQRSQPPAGEPAHHVHLKHAIARMNVAEHERRILEVCCADARHAVLIKHRLGGRAELRDREALVGGRARQPVKPTYEQHDEQREPAERRQRPSHRPKESTHRAASKQSGGAEAMRFQQKRVLASGAKQSRGAAGRGGPGLPRPRAPAGRNDGTWRLRQPA